MDPALRAAFERVTDLYSEEAFVARLAELRAQFGDLLDDEALSLYVVDSHGRNESAVVAVRDCRGRAEATVDVVVETVLPTREFARGEGIGRVQNVVVRDAVDGAEARLVLWDRDIEKSAELKPGTGVRVVHARVKDSRFGVELHVTGWTKLEIAGALEPARLKLLTDTLADGEAPPVVAPSVPLPPGLSPGAPPTASASVPARAPRQATLFEAPSKAAAVAAPVESPIEPERLADARPGDTLHLARFRLVSVRATRPFRRADGSTGFVAEGDVEDAGVKATLVAWDDAIKALRAIPVGATFEATDLVVKEKGGKLELASTRATRLTPAAAPQS